MKVSQIRMDNMNVFIVGNSHSGKTPLAESILRNNPSFRYIQASSWVRELYTGSAEKEEFVKEITALSRELLKRNPDACVESVRARMIGDCVIDGCRNPGAFVKLFDPRFDHALFLEIGYSQCLNSFEGGIAVIKDYLAWLVSNGMITADRIVSLKFDALYEREVSNGGTSLESWLSSSAAPLYFREGT